jgi:hypothetical protein
LANAYVFTCLVLDEIPVGVSNHKTFAIEPLLGTKLPTLAPCSTRGGGLGLSEVSFSPNRA